MECIVSKTNEKVKYLKNLNLKKYRKKYNCYYLEGIKVVEEVLQLYRKKAVNLQFIAYSHDILAKSDSGLEFLSKFNEIENSNIKLFDFSKEIFEYITDTVTPQGVLAVLECPNYTLKDILFDNKNILILDKLQDPGNIGTILRTADAFGINSIICTWGTVDIYSQKTLRSTMASILRQKVVYLDENDTDTTFLKLKKENYYIVGTALKSSENIKKVNLKDKKYCFILGSEANGISNEVLEKCDKLVKIPMETNVESLNVSIAAAILLYEQYNNL